MGVLCANVEEDSSLNEIFEKRNQKMRIGEPKAKFLDPEVSTVNATASIIQAFLDDQKVVNDLPADEMPLDDAFKVFRSAGVIPRPFGVDDGDRPLCADLQAVGLRAVHSVSGKAQFLEPRFQEFPGLQRLRAIIALGLGGISAKENMPLDFVQSQVVDDLLQLCLIHGPSILVPGFL